jgi:hypothetical protein
LNGGKILTVLNIAAQDITSSNHFHAKEILKMLSAGNNHFESLYD